MAATQEFSLPEILLETEPDLEDHDTVGQVGGLQPAASRPWSRTPIMGRRESRLGFKNIFGRSKTAPELATPLTSSRKHQRQRSRNGSIDNGRNSPRRQTPRQSEKTLQTIFSSRPLSQVVEDTQTTIIPYPPSLHYTDAEKCSSPLMQKFPRGEIASWDIPPLFKAYPQASRYSTLPAITMSADAFLRSSDRKAADAGTTNGAVGLAAETADQASLTSRQPKKAARGRVTPGGDIPIGWTTKIYVLATSSCVLQYTGDGQFNRLPEKVLQLSKSSAAFVSDAIPGKHWVLQISANVNDAGAPAPESRSLLSRFPFRAVDRRQASNLFMVFENPDDMSEWLAALRREIESLGGKKPVKETGEAVEDEADTLFQLQPTQSRHVHRDPDRYSETASQHSQHSLQRQRSNSVSKRGLDEHREHSLDDASTSATSSVVSQDGRQLENLRNGNRLSYISTSQRTFVSSACSSPACSPTVENFTVKEDEAASGRGSSFFRSRLRPNAASILDRRQSLQPTQQFDQRAGQPTPRSQLVISPSTPTTPESGASSASPPNFSVPNGSSRRYSYIKTASTELTQAIRQTSPVQTPEGEARSSIRKQPPPPLRLAKPLSMVADQPSPRSSVPERPKTGHGANESAPSTSSESPPQRKFQLVPKQKPSSPEPAPVEQQMSKRLSLAQIASPPTTTAGSRPLQPKRQSSFPGSFAKMSESVSAIDRAIEDSLPQVTNPIRSRMSPPPVRSEYSNVRLRSNLDLRQNVQRSSLVEQPGKRGSMYSVSSRSSDISIPPAINEYLPGPSPPPSVPLPPLPRTASHSSLRADVRAHSLHSRRSMPHLAETAPPAPPPTCALPPIPRKTSWKAT